MAREPSQKLVDYGIVGALLLAGYFAWTAFFKKEAPKECPVGQHAVNPCEGQLGWPAFLCNLGRNVTGALLDCKPDVCPAGYTQVGDKCELTDSTLVPVVPLQRDSFGCLMAVQRWCPIDQKCMDIAQSCTPDPALIPSPGQCYEWSPTFHKWVHSTSIPGCGIITCPDGSQHYAEQCPSVIPRCAESECTPGTSMCANGIPKVCEPLGTGCEDRGIWAVGGNACRPVSNIVDCPCGKIDLNNPPGTTCESACAGSSTPPLGPFKSTHEEWLLCEQACERAKGQITVCFGSEAVCNPFGDMFPDPVPGHPGVWVNQAALAHFECRRRCEYG